MDSVVTAILWLGAAFFAFFLIGRLGFLVPARVSRPKLEPSGPLPLREPEAEIPDYLKSWCNASAGASTEQPATITAWGNGRQLAKNIPVYGQVWVPYSWTLFLLPGNSFIIRSHITWFRKLFVRSGEGLISGSGTFIAGKTQVESEYMDRSETVLCWIYTLLLAHGAVVTTSEVNWLSTADKKARLRISPPGHLSMDFHLLLNSEPGYLQRIDGNRPASSDGRNLTFQVELSDPKEFEEGRLLPSKIKMHWDQEMYNEMSLVGVVSNKNLTDIFAEGVAHWLK